MNDWIWYVILIMGGGIAASIWTAIQNDKEVCARRKGKELYEMMTREPGNPISRAQNHAAAKNLAQRIQRGEPVNFFTKGSGLSGDDPVVIVAPNSFLGVQAEYAWLTQHFGVRKKYVVSQSGWKISAFKTSSDRTTHEGKTFFHPDRMIELFELEHVNGEKKTIFFDITFFYYLKA